MIVNINVGLLGHVDSGKTTLAKILSKIPSTAAFDKNPQSKERGITLDLGFSGVILPAPTHLKNDNIEEIQITFVDCPGHASLIKTIIGGAQIIDIMVIVIDAQKGMQTQTAECIVIAEILRRPILVIVNKIDLIEEEIRDSYLTKLNIKLRKVFAKTNFGSNVPMINVSALKNVNITAILDGICTELVLPERDVSLPLLIYVDHCFAIRGQGTICTGTVIQGTVAVNDVIEIANIQEQRKIKSIQMFHRSVKSARMGDRVGLCVTQFDPKQLERGVLSKPGYLRHIYAACIHINRIKYYKSAIKTNSKFHFTIGHFTVMGKVTLFCDIDENNKTTFNIDNQYEYVEEIDINSEIRSVYALIEFQTSIIASTSSLVIASKLDLSDQSNCCRIAFWGQLQWLSFSSNYLKDELHKFKIFKNKTKQGTIQRLINDQEAIVANLFKKDSNRDVFIGKTIKLSTGEEGQIVSTFGQTSKIKIVFKNPLQSDTLKLIKSNNSGKVLVMLNYKKYLFHKNLHLVQ